MRWWLLLLVACGSDRAAPCTSDRTCPGARCVRGECRPPVALDGACVFSTECESGYCDTDRCTSGKLGTPCSNDVYCASHICKGAVCAADSLGDRCNDGSDCKGADVICRDRRCVRKSKSGESCANQDHCLAGSTCIDGTCLDLEGQRKRAARIETELLAQSGIPRDRTAVERPAHPPGPGQRVRTARAKGKNRVFAACRDDERLIGGGCDALVPSYPSDFSADDTVGARWNCNNTGGIGEHSAYALCMKLP